MNFPHMRDTDFPNVESVDAYKYQNNFDYSKYDKTQMTIRVCSVPWDVGLIHVGNAQIGGLGNVVYFDGKKERDEYLDSIEGYTWDTKYRAYHSNGYIEVPLPYEQCVLYNYCYCEYTRLPVDYAEGGKDRFFFFIRECEYLSPNSTKVTILRDTWQTFIYDVDITHMMLERGHAPMSLVSADRYLSNPIDNTKYLLADDVTYGDATTNRYAASQILNDGDMWAVIVSSVSLVSNPGSKEVGTWHVPIQDTVLVDGQPSHYAYALAPGALYAFLQSLNALAPQLTQCIKAVFFVEKSLVNASTPIDVFGYQIARLSGKNSELPVIDLAKSQFGYGSRYQDIAKLYTSPYAHLEITDENGNAHLIRIEDTTGGITLQLTTSVAYPWLSLDGHLSGVGKGGGSVEFKNVDGHSFKFDGSWYDYLYQWNIPTFAVLQSNQDRYDYTTYFDREQRTAEIETAYGNAVRSADTTHGNAVRSANTAKTNADAADNTGYANAVRSADTAKTNADAADNTGYANAVRNADTAKTNADAADNTGYANAVRSAEAAKSNADASATTAHGNSVRSADASKLSADASDNTGYDNALRSAIASRDNDLDSASTAKANADGSALTAKTNSDNSTRTTKQNSDNSAQTAKSNSDNSAFAAAQNSYDAISTDYTNRINASETAYYNVVNMNTATSQNAADARGTATVLQLNARSYANQKITAQETKMDGDLYWDVASTALQAALSADYNASATIINSAQDALGGMLSGAQMGALAGAAAGVPGAVGGALAGAGASVAGSAASAAFAAANYTLTVTNEQAQVDANEYVAKSKVRIAKTYNQTVTDIEQDNQENTRINNNTLNAATTARSVEASNAAALASHNTEVANSGRSRDTGNANTERSYHASVENSALSYDTDVTNNGNTATTAYTNASNTYDRAVENNSATYDTATINAGRSYDASANNAGATRTTGLANNARARNAAVSNADDTETASLANNARTETAAKANALASRDTGLANNARARNAAVSNADDTETASLANNARTETAAKANALASRDTGLAANNRTNATAKANALASRDTGLAANERTNATAKANALASRDTGLASNARTQTAAIANADDVQETALANAEASRETGLDGITRDIEQAALGAPVEFGEYANGETAATRPQGIFCNIVTQSQDAIEQAGDYFLRFGYAVNRAWDFETFNLMPKFTYWKASDMWISGNNVPDAYLDEIRFYLLGGVCVWRNPDDIGKISIYQNI